MIFYFIPHFCDGIESRYCINALPRRSLLTITIFYYTNCLFDTGTSIYFTWIASYSYLLLDGNHIIIATPIKGWKFTINRFTTYCVFKQTEKNSISKKLNKKFGTYPFWPPPKILFFLYIWVFDDSDHESDIGFSISYHLITVLSFYHQNHGVDFFRMIFSEL